MTGTVATENEDLSEAPKLVSCDLANPCTTTKAEAIHANNPKARSQTCKCIYVYVFTYLGMSAACVLTCGCLLR